jgi:hypothetical protein
MISGKRKLFHPQPYSPLFSMLSKILPILAPENLLVFQLDQRSPLVEGMLNLDLELLVLDLDLPFFASAPVFASILRLALAKLLPMLLYMDMGLDMELSEGQL